MDANITPGAVPISAGPMTSFADSIMPKHGVGASGGASMSETMRARVS